MMPGATKGGGNCVATGPDVCITPVPPPVNKSPVPYPNTGMLTQAQKTSTKVKFVNKEVVTLKSKINQSMGDEAGTDKGVVSGKNMGEIMFKVGSSKVKIEGQSCINQGSTTSHNGSNANVPAGIVATPSQIKVVIG